MRLQANPLPEFLNFLIHFIIRQNHFTRHFPIKTFFISSHNNQFFFTARAHNINWKVSFACAQHKTHSRALKNLFVLLYYYYVFQTRITRFWCCFLAWYTKKFLIFFWMKKKILISMSRSNGIFIYIDIAWCIQHNTNCGTKKWFFFLDLL